MWLGFFFGEVVTNEHLTLCLVETWLLGRDEWLVIRMKSTLTVSILAISLGDQIGLFADDQPMYSACDACDTS